MDSDPDTPALSLPLSIPTLPVLTSNEFTNHFMNILIRTMLNSPTPDGIEVINLIIDFLSTPHFKIISAEKGQYLTQTIISQCDHTNAPLWINPETYYFDPKTVSRFKRRTLSIRSGWIFIFYKMALFTKNIPLIALFSFNRDISWDIRYKWAQGMIGTYNKDDFDPKNEIFDPEEFYDEINNFIPKTQPQHFHYTFEHPDYSDGSASDGYGELEELKDEEEGRSSISIQNYGQNENDDEGDDENDDITPHIPCPFTDQEIFSNYQPISNHYYYTPLIRDKFWHHPTFFQLHYNLCYKPFQFNSKKIEKKKKKKNKTNNNNKNNHNMNYNRGISSHHRCTSQCKLDIPLTLHILIPVLINNLFSTFYFLYRELFQEEYNKYNQNLLLGQQQQQQQHQQLLLLTQQQQQYQHQLLSTQQQYQQQQFQSQGSPNYYPSQNQNNNQHSINIKKCTILNPITLSQYQTLSNLSEFNPPPAHKSQFNLLLTTKHPNDTMIIFLHFIFLNDDVNLWDWLWKFYCTGNGNDNNGIGDGNGVVVVGGNGVVIGGGNGGNGAVHGNGFTPVAGGNGLVGNGGFVGNNGNNDNQQFLEATEWFYFNSSYFRSIKNNPFMIVIESGGYKILSRLRQVLIPMPNDVNLIYEALSGWLPFEPEVIDFLCSSPEMKNFLPPPKKFQTLRNSPQSMTDGINYHIINYSVNRPQEDYIIPPKYNLLDCGLVWNSPCLNTLKKHGFHISKNTPTRIALSHALYTYSDMEPSALTYLLSLPPDQRGSPKARFDIDDVLHFQEYYKLAKVFEPFDEKRKNLPRTSLCSVQCDQTSQKDLLVESGQQTAESLGNNFPRRENHDSFPWLAPLPAEVMGWPMNEGDVALAHVMFAQEINLLNQIGHFHRNGNHQVDQIGDFAPGGHLQVDHIVHNGQNGGEHLLFLDPNNIPEMPNMGDNNNNNNNNNNNSQHNGIADNNVPVDGDGNRFAPNQNEINNIPQPPQQDVLPTANTDNCFFEFHLQPEPRPQPQRLNPTEPLLQNLSHHLRTVSFRLPKLRQTIRGMPVSEPITYIFGVWPNNDGMKDSDDESPFSNWGTVLRNQNGITNYHHPAQNVNDMDEATVEIFDDDYSGDDSNSIETMTDDGNHIINLENNNRSEQIDDDDDFENTYGDHDDGEDLPQAEITHVARRYATFTTSPQVTMNLLYWATLAVNIDIVEAVCIAKPHINLFTFLSLPPPFEFSVNFQITKFTPIMFAIHSPFGHGNPICEFIPSQQIRQDQILSLRKNKESRKSKRDRYAESAIELIIETLIQDLIDGVEFPYVDPNLYSLKSKHNTQ